MGKTSRRKQRAAAEKRVESPRSKPRVPSRVTLSWVPYALILATTAVLYANSFSIPFLFDDYVGIVRNTDIRQLESPVAYLTRSRGITDFTIALNYHWNDLDVWGYHLVNVAVHVVNGWLAYMLALAILRLPFFAGRYRERGRDLATLVALVFVAHPLQTMAVSYLIQRGESLSSMFYLACVLLFTRASALEDKTKRSLWYVAILATTFLGILSKETAATVPFVLLLHHFCFRTRSGSTRTSRWLAFSLLLVPLLYAFYLARFQLLSDTGSDGTAPRAWLFIPSAGFHLEGVSVWSYLLTQFGVVLWYLRLFFLPTRQCFDYAWPFVETPWQLDVVLPFLALLSIAAAGLLSYRRYRLATFCVGWFFLSLAPSSSIIPLRDAAFEQRMYLPIFGLALLVVVGGYDGGRWLAARWRVSGRRVGAVLGTVAALWVAALGGLTVARNHIYQDPMRLAQDTISKSPHNWRAQYEYGDELARRGRVDEAIAALRASIRLAPDKGTARIRLGGIYMQQRRFDEAEEVLEPATHVLEESVVAAAHRQLGYIHLSRGQRDEAERELRQASKLMPRWASVHLELGRLYAQQEQWPGAAQQLNEAIRRNPKLRARVGRLAADASYRAGIVYFQGNRMRAAIDMFRHAVRYRPDFSAARYYLAASYAARQQWDDARKELAELQRQSPEDPLLDENMKRLQERRPLRAPAP